MRVRESIAWRDNSHIEFGTSSWDDTRESIRLRWDRPDGGYDPISSSELPAWALPDLVVESARRNLISVQDIGRMLEALGSSLRQQSGAPQSDVNPTDNRG